MEFGKQLRLVDFENLILLLFCLIYIQKIEPFLGSIIKN